MHAKFDFRGTGGELFKTLFKGWLLTAITFGIYMPWFLISLIKLVFSKTKLRLGEEELELEYTGTGGELFKRFIVGYLLTGITFGIYLSWFIVDLIKFHQSHMTAVRTDGRVYRLDSSLTGGELFKTLFVGYLLTMITFGIYAPWFVCKLQRLLASTTTVQQNGEVVATVEYTAQGGELFKTFLVGYLLTAITFGIYAFWFQVKLLKFFAQNTEITAGGERYRGDFTGTGGENFKLNFVGYLLTMITFGIYGFWYLADLLRFQLGHTQFMSESGETPEVEKPIAVRVAPAARAASVQIAAPRAPSAQLAAPRAASAPKALPAPRPTSAAKALPARTGDTRAAWARAFGIDEPSEQEKTLDGPVRIVRGAPDQEIASDLVIQQTIEQSMHFPELDTGTDRLAAADPVA
jgi:uncharacterized membrane protein YjgN (DUF898 family)